MDINILSLWPIYLSAIGFTIWLVRLESKALYSEKEIVKIESKIAINNSQTELKINVLSGSLNEIKCSLARIEGALSKNFEHHE